jgi:hypothetical protein
MLPAVTGVVETMLGELYAKALRKNLLAGNTAGRRIADISEDICDHFIDQLKTSRSALQVDELAGVQSDARIRNTFVKSTCVAVSSQTSVFNFRRLLDKVEVILNMCYHDRSSQGIEKQDPYTL